MPGIKITIKIILKMIALVAITRAAITQGNLIVLTEGRICIWCHINILPLGGYKILLLYHSLIHFL